MKNSELYPLLHSLPKGCLQHVHIDCCEDVEFYKLHVISDPKVWLTKDWKEMRIGTKEEAEKEGWLSIVEEKNKFGNDEKFAEKVASLTMLTKSEL